MRKDIVLMDWDFMVEELHLRNDFYDFFVKFLKRKRWTMIPLKYHVCIVGKTCRTDGTESDEMVKTPIIHSISKVNYGKFSRDTGIHWQDAHSATRMYCAKMKGGGKCFIRWRSASPDLMNRTYYLINQ